MEKQVSFPKSKIKILLLEGVHAPHVPDTNGHRPPLPAGWERLLESDLVLRCLVGFLASVLLIRAWLVYRRLATKFVKRFRE